MAILTTIGLITLGAVALTTAITAGCYFATEEDRARAQIEENNSNIRAYKSMLQDCNLLKTKLYNAESYLKYAKSDFANGGHVLDNVPLANTEFESCFSKINSAVSSLSLFISNLNSAILELEAENRELQRKI